MNLNVEHVLMFALFVCALYYLGNYGIEGWNTEQEYQRNIDWCTKKMEKCLCEKTGFFHSPIGKENRNCNNEVDKIMLPEEYRDNQYDKCVLYPYQDSEQGGNLSWLDCLDLS